MINFEDTKTRHYEIFIRNIANTIVQRIDYEKLDKEGKSFLTKTKERFRFDSDKGWKFLVSSLDTIGDSQFAITTFINHKIENGKKFNTGENYLRLYGLLSAVYIQQQAMLKLSDLLKTGHLDNLKTDFDKLENTFLRHCISAHPVNFDNNGTKVSSRIDRNYLNDKGELSIRDESNNAISCNVFKALNEYITKTEETLEIICEKLISNCYKSTKEKRKEINNELEIRKKTVANKG